MFRTMYRQRRRALFGSFFYLLMLGTMFFSDPPEWYAIGWNPVVVWGVIVVCFAVVGICATFVFALFATLLPRWRCVIELVAFVSFLELAFRELVFDYRSLFVALDVQWAAAFAMFGLFILCFKFTYGNGLDRFTRLFVGKARGSAVVMGTPEEIWERIIAANDIPADHIEPNLKSVEKIAEADGALRVIYNFGASTFLAQTHRVLQSNRPNRYVYAYEGDASDRNGVGAGQFEVTITPEWTDRCRVDIMLRSGGMYPRQALITWFDDTVGDLLDSFRARRAGKRDWSVFGLSLKDIAATS